MIEVFQDPKVFIPTVTSIIAGIWILKDFLIKRELYPKPKIETGMRIIRKQKNGQQRNIALVWIRVKNNGAARLYIDQAHFYVRHLPQDLEDREVNISGVPMIDFPVVVVKSTSLFPEKWKYSYVDGGGETEYRFTVGIPASIGLYSIHTEVSLREKKSDFIQDITFYKLDAENNFKKVETSD
jgi:hypothetical protein